MNHQQFTIAGSTLSLLKPGEQGIVTRIASLDITVVHKLRSMGVVPGTIITLKQRSPQYLIQVGEHHFALSQATAKAIYLRLQPASAPSSSLDHLNQWALAMFKQLSMGSRRYPQPMSSSVIGR